MILIAESGSTHTSWRLVENHTVIIDKVTAGINPVTMDAVVINEIVSTLKHELSGEKIAKVYFYGAGCTGTVAISKMREILSAAYPHAVVFIESDLLAAARALKGHEKGLVAILGTGSNSCFYDGASIKKSIPSLGYVLGDEGSGSDLGRRLLKSYLRGFLPKELHEAFRTTYPGFDENWLQQLYRNPMAGSYMATFVPFLKDHLKNVFCRNLVIEAFDSFAQQVILRYPESSQAQVSFCGSVAWFFKDELKMALNRYQVETGNFLREAIDGLVEYHLAELPSGEE